MGPLPGDEAPAFRAARDICRAHARSFYFASHFLPKPKRNGAYAVYAFCRMLDDAIDEPDAKSPSLELLDARLRKFEERLDQIYAGKLSPARPIEGGNDELAFRAFAATVHRYELPKQYFLDLLAGCRMDLTVSRYQNWEELEKYCYRVAGVVGLIMSRVFNVRDEAALKNAVGMGNAMQLTNILRDVREDRDRGRIYLPLEDMVRFGYTEADLAAGIVNENLRGLMRFEVARARQLYREGALGLRSIPADGSRFTAASMAEIYSGILDAIEKQDYNVFAGRARLTGFQKLRRLPRAWAISR